MEEMEAAQRRTPNVADVSDEKSEEVEVEEAVGEDAIEERLLRAITRLGGRAKIEVPMYKHFNTSMDWIRSMDKHFNYEDVNEKKKVK